MYGHTVVISRRQLENASGKFFSSIFDELTALGVLTSVALVILAVYAISRLSPSPIRNRSLCTIATYLTGMFLCQGLPRTFRLCNAARILASFYSIFAIIITTVFSGELRFSNFQLADSTFLMNLIEGGLCNFSQSWTKYLEL